MDQNKDGNTTKPTASGGSDQPAMPPDETSSLARSPSMASAFPLLAALRDSASAAAADDVDSTTIPTPRPIAIAAVHANPAAQQPQVPSTAVDAAVHVASSSTDAAVNHVPSTATAGGAKNETPRGTFTWKTNRALLNNQRAAARMASGTDTRPRKAHSPPRRSQDRQQDYELQMTWRTRTNCVVGECKRYPCDVCGYHYDFQLDRRQVIIIFITMY
ncbi:uncharacterized protein LOC125941333 [Dermacentor silvarum]|uniref:uncharacterized protein LOC125941333 n=1 Tax=Dermacentor silvarum TaxID=543639 RepID=UPI002100F873|nr:uncharacterized protein LOC125941333 [Dermacentor silvarum]